MNKGVALIAALFFCLSVYAPILFVYVAALISPFAKKILPRNYYSLLYFAIFLNAAFSLALLLANRPYLAGFSAGYGDDMHHYANAFDYVVGKGYGGFSEMLDGVVWYTGGGEPFFWLFVSFLSVAFHDPVTIHVMISVIGFLFVYLAGELLGRQGILCFVLYISTITMYAFQGSAIRSGFAFSIMLLAAAFYVREKRIGSALVSIFASMSHFSMAPIAPAFFLRPVSLYWNWLRFLYPVVAAIIVYTAFIFLGKGGESALEAKIALRADDVFSDQNSVVQFIFEAMVMGVIAFYFRRIVDRNAVYLIFYVFVLCLFFLLVMPSVFPRFYRYEYVFYIVFFVLLVGRIGFYNYLLIILVALCWHVFIVDFRYAGIFWGETTFDHMSFSWIDY